MARIASFVFIRKAFDWGLRNGFSHIMSSDYDRTGKKGNTPMLLAKRMAKELELEGIKVLGYEESKNPKFMDGEVSLENSFSVQVGSDYACLCVIKGDDIDYLLELEEMSSEADCAKKVAKFLLLQPK